MNDSLREDYVTLYAAISQDKNLAKTLHIDSRVVGLSQSTTLTPAQGQLLLGVMYKAGDILYQKLFVTSAEPDLVSLPRNYGRVHNLKTGWKSLDVNSTAENREGQISTVNNRKRPSIEAWSPWRAVCLQCTILLPSIES